MKSRLSTFSIPVWAILAALSLGCERDRGTDPHLVGEPAKTSPQRIVFVSDRETFPMRQIYLIWSDGSQRTRVSHDVNDYIHPAFSPDGTTILAVATTLDSSDEIYSMSIDGSNIRNLSNSTGDDNFASYSPDGSKIVFASTRDGNSEIYIMDSDGRNKKRLTDSELIDHAPQFTPDGSRILYCSTNKTSAGTDTYDYDIYLMNLDGSNKIRLTKDGVCHLYPPLLEKGPLSRNMIVKPSISSDGARILFLSYDWRTGNNWVMMMDANGGNCHVVSAIDFFVAPTFTPDNSRIVFTSHRGGKYDIYEMGLDGNRQTKLTRGTPGHVFFSQFSPDGSTILFATDVSTNLSGAYETIWAMNWDGTYQTQITFGGGNDYTPRYQPIRK